MRPRSERTSGSDRLCRSCAYSDPAARLATSRESAARNSQQVATERPRGIRPQGPSAFLGASQLGRVRAPPCSGDLQRSRKDASKPLEAVFVAFHLGGRTFHHCERGEGPRTSALQRDRTKRGRVQPDSHDGVGGEIEGHSTRDVRQERSAVSRQANASDRT